MKTLLTLTIALLFVACQKEDISEMKKVNNGSFTIKITNNSQKYSWLLNQLSGYVDFKDDNGIQIDSKRFDDTTCFKSLDGKIYSSIPYNKSIIMSTKYPQFHISIYVKNELGNTIAKSTDWISSDTKEIIITNDTQLK